MIRRSAVHCLRGLLGRTAVLASAIALATGFSPKSIKAQATPLRVYISVDMEGIGGIGTGKMTTATGKDYALGRQLMTDEVNAVVEAIQAFGPSEILVNDSHGDHQNLLHTQLNKHVQYIQGSNKSLGMVSGLDRSFDAAIFVGYHARAGTTGGFLAHTGSGSVKGLWINDVEVGEGGMNAYFAGFHDVPVILASGDSVFAAQFGNLTGNRTVSTKVAVSSAVARLEHPAVVKDRLRAATSAALAELNDARTIDGHGAINIRMRFASTIRPDVLIGIPGIRRIDGYTVEYDAKNMDEAYRLIRLMYKFISF